MPDREKYIEILSKAAKTVKEFNEDTPIKISLECIEDILELLKEQEAVEPVPDYNIRYWRCPKCNWLLASMIDDKCDIPVRRDNYCARCGRAVKWE